TLDGQPFNLAALQGESVLVHFWADWCPLCKLMDGAISALAQDHVVVTVAMQSGEPAELRDLMRESGRDYRVIADPRGEIAARWGVPAVPATFVLDSAGRIRASTVGASTETGLRLRLWHAGQLDPRGP
ncbi:MAG: protein disulfide oxidoreductase, partial [Opitutae bacterium]|nr:protein disulfide oxidoreductase [Opitutae bacterium]